MSKTVVIASAKSNTAVRIEGFTGTTFADLKANCQFNCVYGDGNGVEVVIKPGNITLRGDDSVLPEGNFSVFIIATKNKAGMTAAEVREITRSIEIDIISKSRRASAAEKTALRANLASAVAQVYSTATGTVAPSNPAPAAITVDTELEAALAEAQRM